MPGAYDIDIPIGGEILSIGTQVDQWGYAHACMWVLVDTDYETERRSFEVFGTGHMIIGLQTLKYISRISHDSLEWHIFEKVL